MSEPLVCNRCGSAVGGARCLKCGGSPVSAPSKAEKLRPTADEGRPSPRAQNTGQSPTPEQPDSGTLPADSHERPAAGKDPSTMTTAEKIMHTEERIVAAEAHIGRLQADVGSSLGTVRADVKVAQEEMSQRMRSEVSQLETQRAAEMAEEKEQAGRIRAEFDRESMLRKNKVANKVKQTSLQLRDLAKELDAKRATIPSDSMTSEDLVPGTQVRELVTVGTLMTPAASALDRSLPSIPALVPFVDAGHLIVETPSGTSNAPNDTFRALLTSLVAQTYASAPCGQMVVTVFNPRSSKVLAGFRPTGAETAGLLKVLQPTREALETSLEEHLTLTQRAESSIGTYRSLGELVRNTGQHEHQYHVLVILDGPDDWSPKSIELLEKIMASGSKAGLSVLLHRNPSAAPPERVDITKLYKYGSVLAHKDGGWLLEVPGSTARGARIEPVEEVTERAQARLMELVVSAAKDGSLPSIPFAELVERTPGTSEHGLSITMGKKGTQKTEFILGDTVSNIQNVLIGGRAGSGKTNLLKVMIYSMAARYPREELELFLLDFKEGGDFMPFVGDRGHDPLPNATVVSRECDAGFGLATLRHFAREMKRRANLTSDNGVSNIWDLRERTDIKLPRWVLIIDEFQGLFTGPTYQEATELLEDFVRKGRSFGLHVILATQTLSGVKFAGDKDRAIFENISGRVVLQLGPGEFTRFMESGNDEGDQLRYRGQAIFNPMGGRKNENQLFVVARADSEHMKELQDELYHERETTADTVHPRPFVYRGDETVSAERLLRDNGAPRHRDGELPAWYGRENTIDPPVACSVLSPIAGSHILLLGGDEATMSTAISTLQTAVLSAVAAEEQPIDVIVFEELIRKYRSGALIEKWLNTLAVLGANVVRFDADTVEAFVQAVSDASAARKRTIVAMLGAENSDFARVADDNNQWRTLIRDMPRRNINLIGHWSDIRDLPGDKNALKSDYKTMLFFGTNQQLVVDAAKRTRYDLPPLSNKRTVVLSANTSQNDLATVTSIAPLSEGDLEAFSAIADHPVGSVRVGGVADIAPAVTQQEESVAEPNAGSASPGASIPASPQVAASFTQLLSRERTYTTDAVSAVLGESTSGITTARLGSNGASNLLISGKPLMGTGQAAKRLIYALAAHHASLELQIDLIDSDDEGDFSEIGVNTLQQVATSEHTSNESRIGHVLARYTTEVQRRFRLFNETGSTDYREHRRGGHELARWVVIWNAFTEVLTPAVTAQLEWLARYGPGAGVHLVLSAVAPVSAYESDLPQFFANSGRLLFHMKPDESEALLGNEAAANIRRRSQGLITHGPGQSATVFTVPTFEDGDVKDLHIELGGSK